MDPLTSTILSYLAKLQSGYGRKKVLRRLSGQVVNASKSMIIVSKNVHNALKNSMINCFFLASALPLGRYLKIRLIDGKPKLRQGCAKKWLEAKKVVRRSLVNYSLMPMLYYTLAHCHVPQEFTFLNLNVCLTLLASDIILIKRFR